MEEARNDRARLSAAPDVAAARNPVRRGFLFPTVVAIVCFAVGVGLGHLVAPTDRECHGFEAIGRFAIILPSGAPLAAGTHDAALALAPGGDRLVYVARIRSGKQLYIRHLDQFDASPVPGTQGASNPFFSPDGNWVAFFADGRLKKVSLRGGEPTTLCEAGEGGGGSWGADGQIYFVPAKGAGIFRVSSSGGLPQVVTPPGVLPVNAWALWPELLTGSRTLLYTLVLAQPEDAMAVWALRPSTGESAALVERGAFARFAPTGHLLFARGSELLAAPFDPVALRVTGRPVQVLEGILADPTTGAAQFALSTTGTLIFAPSEGNASERTLLWVDRGGRTTSILPYRRDFDAPRLSPDGRRLAVSVAEGRGLEIWIIETQTGALRRFVSQGSSGLPVWCSDSRSLTFVSPRAGAWTIFRRNADGRGESELLVTSENPLSPSDWSRDDQTLLYTEAHPETGGDIWALKRGPKIQVRPLARTPADEWGAVFSPDGRFIAYTSDASGRDEVYLRPFPGPGEARKISEDGGYGPAWSRLGTEVYFRRNNSLFVVAVTTRPSLVVGPPRWLFDGSFKGPSAASPNYDVSPDSERFVFTSGAGIPPAPQHLTVVLNWFEEMKRRVLSAQE